VSQLTQLLKEITVLVKESGDIVDEIERKIRAAAMLATKGVENLDEAKKQHQMAKGKQWWMCICALMALTVVGAPTILTILSNMNII